MNKSDVEEGVSGWERVRINFLAKRRKLKYDLLPVRVTILLILFVTSVLTAILFPRQLEVKVVHSYLSVENITSLENSVSGDLNITFEISNFNVYGSTVQYFGYELKSGPLDIANQTIGDLDLYVPANGQMYISQKIHIRASPDEFLNAFNVSLDEESRALLELSLSSITSNFIVGKLTLSVNGQVDNQFSLLLFPMPRYFAQSIDIDNTTMYESPYYQSGKEIFTLPDSPPVDGEVVNKAATGFPYWFIYTITSLVVLIIVYFSYLGFYELINYVYFKKLTKLQQEKSEEHSKIGRKNLKPTQIAKDRYDIRFENLGLKVGDNWVLQGVTGEFPSGRLTAIMGPSGCGKTSLLSTLSGRAKYGVVHGDIFINGAKSKISNFSRVEGFVPQEDIMIRTLTVEEILEFSANTRLPSDSSLGENERIVEEVIELLGLERIRHSIIGDEDVRGISGGQRKRVNIAMELVSNPGMLFLDEPTSGLDSSSSEEVCSVLQLLAGTGLTIVAVVHQPRYEIFQMFDDVALLGVGGRPVYMGPTKNVASYFAQYGFQCPPQINPADYYLDVISGKYDDQMTSKFSTPELDNVKGTISMCLRLQSLWSHNDSKKHHDVGFSKASKSSSTKRSKTSNSTKSMKLSTKKMTTESSSSPPEEEESDSDNDLPMKNIQSSKSPKKYDVDDDEEDDKGSVSSDSDSDTKSSSFQSRDSNSGSSSSSNMSDVGGVTDTTDIVSSYGSTWDVFKHLLLSIACPWSPYLFYTKIWRKKSLNAKFGGVLGSTLFCLWVLIAIAASIPGESWVFVLIPVMISGLIAEISYYLYHRIKGNYDPNIMDYPSLCMLGLVSGPFSTPMSYLFLDRNRKLEAGLFSGFSAFILFSIVWIPGKFGDFSASAIVSVVSVFVIVKYITYTRRFFTIYAEERTTRSFFYQTFLVTRRDLTVQFRAWKEVLFHLGQVLFGGLFMGLIFYDRPYKGPMIELSEGQPICPADINSEKFKTFCTLFQYPQDEVLIPTASLNLLTIALCAVAYAVPVFGKEQTVFKRETSTGSSSGSYCLGKMIAHLPITFIAPGIYLFAYAGLGVLRAR
eukprot:TRINITY_DN976_c1_g4_i2.p1 TRINITY_DN976_c1_g4~~TRINITY_DN976_c1_g4_i2.p1  ORF type:complete len:1077 (+),score=199.65 TRINITY_DN976_c1_g4_i2:108-3338(+)